MKPKVTKKYLELLVQSSRQRVLDVLFRHPETEFSLSDLAKEAKVAKPHIGPILAELTHLGLISIIKLSKIWRIKANRQSDDFIKSKIVHNLDFIYQSGLVEFLNERFGNPKAIILFGSFRQGEDLSTSDIDIAIEGDAETEQETFRLEELIDFERTIDRKIQIHIFSRKDIDVHVFNNIGNGIVLHGFLEMRP